MSDVKQVKVDNWGIYFLQRLKHFFNRTDYCDLTLQFQDNAQLKVHRLVLSACTEYFELLERTCEMYEDCLVMPDDLQADVVVPIISFMYTGQLEFKMDLLEKLYQTSLIMNMPVLTKLLASHRTQQPQSNHQVRAAPNSYYSKRYTKNTKATVPLPSSSTTTNKRTFSNAFETVDTRKPRKQHVISKSDVNAKNGSQDTVSSSPKFPIFSEKNKHFAKDPRPTRYELPEELDEDNIFDNSFTNISYTSKPLMVHPETTKQYSSKRIKLFEEGTSSRFMQGTSNNDIVECKKNSVSDSFFLDESSIADENDTFDQSLRGKDSRQLFDQLAYNNDCPNITIETNSNKQNKQSGNSDHAKIISEVLKKYPHLVKSNKHIKLKILNTPNKPKKSRTSNVTSDEKEIKVKNETPDFTYETDVIDSKEAARLIALGAENIRGPWICLICGTPGKALHFTSYYNFRKHLVDIHNEKPVCNICEYCGLKSAKRNYLVHHQLTKHGVDPPSHYNFPKCNYCTYIALNEALMVKHKLTHTEVRNFRRNVNISALTSSNLLLDQTQKTGKYDNDIIKHNYQCFYCLRNFLRVNNFYAHLKTNHKEAAKNDGIIEDSDDEIQEDEKSKSKHNTSESSNYIKLEIPLHYDNSFDDNNVQYQIERRPDGNIHVVSKKPRIVMPMAKHKILNPGFFVQQPNNPSITKPLKAKTSLNTSIKRNEFLQELCVSPTSNINSEDVVVIDNNEYIVQDFQLIPKKEKSVGEYLITNSSNSMREESMQSIIPTTSMEFHNIHNPNPDTKVFVKKPTNTNQPIQIVVSNEEEYKALVNNQSVIFDDGDSNKALTVLASGEPMNTATIDLENTQSNDMMIIQDDYSINVSEAVAADNSNIVVVYSHPVEDQNKQYQIITSQGVEAQFVPSSAIITQNYETVTTRSPIVSTHPSLDNTWQNNIQTNINKLPMIASDSELHAMTVAESVTIAPETDSINSINEYTEVPASTSESIPININQIVESQIQTTENNYNESNVLPNITEEISNVPVCQPNSIITLEHPTIIRESLQHTITESNIQQLSSSNIDNCNTVNTFDAAPSMDATDETMTPNTLEILAESAEETRSNEIGSVYVEEILEHQDNQNSVSVPQTIVDSTIEIDEPTKSLNVDVNVTEVDDNVRRLSSSNEHILTEELTNTNLVQEEINEEAGKIEEANEIEVDETIENIARDIGVNPNTIATTLVPKVIESPDDVPVPKVALAQIENLTSEWSEDESETLVENENKSENSISETKDDDVEETSEVEESIENIQQEMDKQVAEKLNSYAVDEDLTSGDHNVPKLSELPENNKDNDVQAISKEKISLLLNDWDDNDSQEDNTTSSCENKIIDQESTPLNSNENVEKVNEVIADKSDLSKNDNIKSLVSDWDEDDDESKE